MGSKENSLRFFRQLFSKNTTEVVLEEPAPPQTVSSPEIPRELREQMLKDANRWDEPRDEDVECKKYTWAKNLGYIPTRGELDFWRRIFDGDDTLHITELVRRMLFDKVLDITPQNTTMMVNLIFRANYNDVLYQPKGRLNHEYKLKELL